MYLNPSPFAQRRHSAEATYTDVGVESIVHGADPHKLISLLFDGFFEATQQAKSALARGDFEQKSKSLSKAARIIDEGLRGALDLRGGAELAADLEALYAYVGMRLTQANLRNDLAMIDECQSLVQPLREAWQGIRHMVDA